MSNLIPASIIGALSLTLGVSPQVLAVQEIANSPSQTNQLSQTNQAQAKLADLEQRYCAGNTASPERGSGRREW
ncbi:MAG: hypothetical protein HC825_07595 [Oscillatoriales cyanobacterium RM1_1_9]|nr:hypothetical protein [Oscillatoriales cyanobacterium SM2_3_0]NJO45109.1 hypothetical protein [Oscillatoriales cyanobacterium RM2_1_1]NJO71574.1 hypothetical protein [Oscillatoriales cyanobacterium RM1_1_9]